MLLTVRIILIFVSLANIVANGITLEEKIALIIQINNSENGALKMLDPNFNEDENYVPNFTDVDRKYVTLIREIDPERFENVDLKRSSRYADANQAVIALGTAFRLVQLLGGESIPPGSSVEVAFDQINAFEDQTVPEAILNYKDGEEPSDFAELDEKYKERRDRIRTDDPQFDAFPGIRERAKSALIRLTRAFFAVAAKLELSDWLAKSAIAKGNELFALSTPEQYLGLMNGADHLTRKEVNSAFEKRKNELNWDKQPISSKPGLSDAIKFLIGALEEARDIVKERAMPGGSKSDEANVEEERRKTAEVDTEFDGKPPREMSSTCKDEVWNCRENAFLCKNRYYVSIMHQNCRQTCAVCWNSAEQCTDRNKVDCPLWGRAFCDSANYSKGMKMMHCAKTCGLCPPDNG